MRAWIQSSILNVYNMVIKIDLKKNNNLLVKFEFTPMAFGNDRATKDLIFIRNMNNSYSPRQLSPKYFSIK